MLGSGSPATKHLFKVLGVTLLRHPFYCLWASIHSILVSLQQVESIHLLINENSLALGGKQIPSLRVLSSFS